MNPPTREELIKELRAFGHSYRAQGSEDSGNLMLAAATMLEKGVAIPSIGRVGNDLTPPRVVPGHPAGTAPYVITQEDRERFEAEWKANKGVSFTFYIACYQDGNYVDPEVDTNWATWQAALEYERSRPSEPSPVPGVGLGEWQPISTAPKDGTRFLGFGKIAWLGSPSVGVAYWYGPCWVFVCGNTEATLTHWMPLPRSPQEVQ